MADINTIIQTSIKMLMANPCQTKIEVSSLHNDVGSRTWDLGIGHAYWDISLVRASPRENKDGCLGGVDSGYTCGDMQCLRLMI